MYIEKTLLHKFRLKTYIPEHKLTFLSSLVYADKKIYAECLDIENRAQIVYQIEESSGKWKPIISEYLPNLELEPLTQFSIKDNKVYYLHENKILLKNLLDMDESTIYAGSDIKQMELCGDYIVYSLHEGEKYLLKKCLLDGSDDTIIAETYATNLIAHKNNLYFLNYNAFAPKTDSLSPRGICKISLDSNKISLVKEGEFSWLIGNEQMVCYEEMPSLNASPSIPDNAKDNLYPDLQRLKD